MYYGAIVKIDNIIDHPNADRLSIAVIGDTQTVITKNDARYNLNDLYVYFPPDGCLSPQMLAVNRLYRKHPITGEEMGGYFDKNGRVRIQKLRGSYSSGLIMPLESLEWTGYNIKKLKEGEQISKLNDDLVCWKFVRRTNRRGGGGGAGVSRKKMMRKFKFPFFKEHFDTPKLTFMMKFIPQGSIIYFTEKLHGTSGRTGYTLVEAPDKWYHRLLKKIGINLNKPYYDFVTGSRRVIRHHSRDDKPSDIYRKKIHDVIKKMPLLKGETIYYEIVGYGDGGKPIMDIHGIPKEYQKKYGDRMVYSYGCTYDHTHSNDPGHNDKQFAVYVYRITQEGKDLPFSSMKKRVFELNMALPTPFLNVVPTLFVDYNYDGNMEGLVKKIKSHAAAYDGTSFVDHKTILEGIVLWVEHSNKELGFHALKWKTDLFCELEDIAKNDFNYVDIEDEGVEAVEGDGTITEVEE